MPIDPHHWQRLSPWLDQVLDLPTEQRPAWLDDLAGRDAALAGELRALLDGGAAGPVARVLQGPAPSVAMPSLAGRRIGAYTLVEPLGEGGMGAVWLAERCDDRFEGRAAVKLLHAGLLQRALAARFRREGAILARLAHPHIARLVDAGLTDDGQPYLVLEHVAGERIDRWCDARRLDLRSRLALFGQVLQAVQHAHSQLVVHRDLKPANVMVDEAGAVKLLDFGIAKLLDDDGAPAEATELTRDAGRVLTPLYAAPEQTRGDAVTTATDVYALGLLLYVLLTGQHPRVDAHGKTVTGGEALPPASRVVTDAARRSDDGLRAAAAARVTTPARLAGALAGDLDNILAKALRPEPGERYATVAAFADDLQRHLDGHTVSARPDSWAYRASRFVARNKLAVGLSGAALAAIVGVAVVADQQRRAAERERDLVARQRAATDAVASFLEQQLGQIDGPGRTTDPAARIEQAERRTQQLFFDQPEVLVRLNALFHGLNNTLGRDEARNRNSTAIEAAAQQFTDPYQQAEVLCGPEPQMSDEESIARIDRGLALLPAGVGSSALRARCLIHRNSHLQGLGRYDEALRDLEAAYASAPVLEQRLMKLSYLRSKAWALNEVGQQHLADRALAEVGDLMREAGRERSVRMWGDLDSRAIFHWHMGRPREALGFLAQAAELAHPGGGAVASHPFIAALRANMLADLDRLDEARSELDRLHRRDGRLQTVFGRMDVGLPLLYRLRGEFEAAVDMLERAYAEERDKHAPWRASVNRMFLAETHLERGNGPRALAALAELEATPKVALLRFQLHELRSRAHLLAGNPIEAEAAARLAVAEAIRRASAERRSATHGKAHLNLARALVAQGRASEARAAAERAVVELSDALGPDHSATRAAVALVGR